MINGTACFYQKRNHSPHCQNVKGRQMNSLVKAAFLTLIERLVQGCSQLTLIERLVKAAAS